MFSNWKLASKIGIVLLALFCGAFWFFNHKSLGFSVAKISSSLTYHPEWESGPLSSDVKAAVFGQKYKYLASGAQSYAFVSEDGRYVIKFFRMKHLVPSFLDNLQPAKKKRRQQNLRSIFAAYKMANDELKEESGLVYIHLNKTHDLQTTLTVFDKIGREHQIDLDKTEFVVQEKAELIFTHLKKLHSRQEIDQAVAAVLSLVQRRINKGFADEDKAVSHNYGFVGGRPIHLDIGRLRRGEKPGEYDRIHNRIEKWLQEHSS